jgi:hypothetical protein
MASCTSECIFTFLYEGDNIHSFISKTVWNRTHVHIYFFA